MYVTIHGRSFHDHEKRGLLNKQTEKKSTFDSWI